MAGQVPCYLQWPKGAPPKPPLCLLRTGHGHRHIYVGLDSPKEAHIREGERDIRLHMNAAGETPNLTLSARTWRTLICRLPRRISETTP